MKRKRAVILLTVLLLCLLSVPVSAAETEISKMPDIPIPGEVEDYFPRGEDPTRHPYDFHFFIKTGIRIFALALPHAAEDFLFILGLLILLAILNQVKKTVSGEGMRFTMQMVGTLCIATAVFKVTDTLFSFVTSYIESVTAFMTQITPVMTGFMAASGKFTSSACLSGVIYLAVSLLQTVVTGTLFPMIRICFCLSVVATSLGFTELARITPFLKKIIGYIFGFVTVSLSAVLMFQSIISKSADSVSMRGIKFAVGSFVPIVGGAVNEAMATVLGGIGVIKSATGVTCAVIVTLLALVPVIRILVHKMLTEFLAFAASLLDLQGENKLLSEIASFLGYTAAVTSVSAVFFILSLAMMATV